MSTIRASDLTTSFDKLQLDHEIEDLVSRIDLLIQSANQAGQSYVEYTPPRIMDVKRSALSDAKLYIITELIKIYNKAGFTVRIKNTQSGNYTLNIRWTSGISLSERADRESLLKRYMI